MPALAATLPLGGAIVKVLIVGSVALAAGRVAGAIIKKANQLLNMEV